MAAECGDREKTMRSTRTRILVLAAVTTLVVLSTPPATAQSDPPVRRGAETVDIVTPTVFEGDLRDLPLAPAWRPGDPIKEIPRRTYPRPGMVSGPPVNPTGITRDPLLDQQERVMQAPTRAFSSPDVDVAGMGFSGVNPPDTVGDVGPSYYIQAINGSTGTPFTVHNKDGSVAAGPVLMETLATSNFCGNGLGDPIVLYDELDGRWLLSEFSSSGNRMCVYISQTGDPISGGWYAYDFSATNFPDYPKYAVWPDAYYVGTNENSVAAYALERSAMLNGQAASLQRFTAPDLGGFAFQMITPSDLDGAMPPPAGAPAYFLRHNDDESHNPGSNNPNNDFLEIFEFAVDFASPANSTFTGPFQVAIAEIDSNLCGLVSFNCIAQPGTSTTLDPLREVVMWRSQYRNFGTHEVLVGNLATDVNGNDRAGVRWYELRKSGGNWGLFQEGTYAIDSDSRWMGSAAMDGNGNIAVGYNVSSSSTFPSLRYAGRLASDPAGTLPQGENSLVAGTASNASNRYGDYSSLNVDPVDDCTFWFTGEYNTSSQWSTRIGAFSFAGCGGTCGNNVIEGSEVCDGTDLGGATCSGEGCTGGTLACNQTCSGFDTSNCTGCPPCDDDGICDAGEDCIGCASDCIGGTTSGAVCGNGLCEAGDGEDCVSCAADCNGKQNGKPANRFCCGDGDGQGPVGCGDSRCTTGGFSCTNDPRPPVSYCCGDFICEGAETIGNCTVDCDTCGNGTCDEGEDSCSCANDCGPPAANEVGMCDDQVDNDCDGAIDCADTADCREDAACVCSPGGTVCTANDDCCSNKCKGGQCRGN
jgi:hypothetical protein